MLRERLDFPVDQIGISLGKGFCNKTGRTAHVQTRQDHLPSGAVAELDRVRDERLRRHFLDDRVPARDDVDPTWFVDYGWTDPIVGEGDLGEAEDTVRSRERGDGRSEGFVMRGHFSVVSAVPSEHRGTSCDW